MYIPKIITHSFAIDYLTIGTYDIRLGHMIADSIFSNISDEMKGLERVDAQRMQYKGEEFNGVFCGSANQGGKPHFMIDAKGGWAEYLFSACKALSGDGSSLMCSRIDVQATVSEVSDLSGMFINIHSGKWQWRGRKLKYKGYIGSDGTDSIDFGGKIAEIKNTVYIKQLGEDVFGTRHEVKYRGKQARALFATAFNKKELREYLKGIMYKRWKKFPVEFEEEMRRLYDSIPTRGENVEGFRFSVDKSLDGTFDWWVNVVLPSTHRLLASKYKNEMENYIGGLYAMCNMEKFGFDNNPF